MAEEKLKLFEALQLRDRYDRKIDLLKNVLQSNDNKPTFGRSGSANQEQVPASGYEPEELETALKNLQSKRVKLNQAIQRANLNNTIEFQGEEISIAEALERRKGLIEERSTLKDQVQNSTHRTVLHKEERDVRQDPDHDFRDRLKRFEENEDQFYTLMNRIHRANHTVTVEFRYEEET